jgi:lipoprotein NlpI
MPKTSAKIRRALVAVPCLLLGIGLLVRAPATHVLAQAAAPSGGQGRGQYTAVDGKVLPTAETLPQDMEHQGDYKLPFGADPYLPSEAKAEFPGFLQPADFPSAAYCGHCHADVHAQWRQSAHANSFRTPWYLKNVKELADSKGVAYTRHCEGCHNPVALFTGALTEGSTVARPHDEDGITCMVCHSIREVQSTKGIGSYVMGKPAVMIDGSGKPVAGLPSDQQILAHLDWHKQAVMRPIYHTSEYCAVCHKAAIPKMLNDYKWLRTFSTYDEWQQSSWSRETPLTFYKKPATSTCQTCHMQREATSDAASHGKPVASHRWLGANTAVAAYYGFDEQAKRLVDFLRDDQLEVDIFGITVERDPAAGNERFTPGSLIAPLGNKGFTVLPGDCVRVDVVVRNKGIGHTLVPELRDFYESWVDFEAKDDAGRTIYRSGAVDQNHSVDPDAHSYTLRIVSRDGTSLDHHEVWKTYVKAYDATISPGRADIVRYRFRIPNDAKGVSITASVRYRRFRKSFTDWVFSDKPSSPDRFPTVTLASGSFHFNTGDNAPHREETLPDDATGLLRWNNYGIGMLDRQQYAEAVDAFKHVVEIDPKYEPGYVNVAIAEYSRGRYADALAWLGRSSALDPGDARAMYYKGLSLRWQTHYDEAIAALEPVARQYPRFRQVHQELGYLYLIGRRYPEAKAQYETVLRIDPDDPTTHRWLGPVYAALGDSAGATREAVLAAQTGNDTSAGWVAQSFWRENPSVASKSMPAHTYSAGNLMDDADVRRVLNLMNPPSYIWIEHY